MAFRFAIYPQVRLVYASMSGRISREEVPTLRREVAADPRFDPAFDAILDFHEADLSSMSSVDVEQLAQRTVLDRNARRVLVADRVDTFGLARMYQARRDIAGAHDPLLVVRTLDEALEWLGIDGVYLPPGD